ncbi:MAG: ATP-binding protein, partial [Streptosporangiales bacterium]|nr:ATP-binding protein [Streptosporangiales bacterium]
MLAAIAAGNRTRGGIANYLARKSGDLAHPLTVLEDRGLISREADAFRHNRTTFHIAEPLISFYHAVMRPIWSDLEFTRETPRLWERSKGRFDGNIMGPHFERVCRLWTRHMAPPELFGDYPNRVESGTVHDPANRTTHEVDVVVFGLDDDGRSPVLAIGEAKWQEVMELQHLQRLRRLRELLVAQGRHGAANARLVCYSGAGFAPELRDEAERHDDVVVVGL